MRYEYEIDPFPAVRSNRNSWNKKTKAYHAKMNDLREAIGEDKEEIIEKMIEGNYRVLFVLPIPKSWSINKKKLYDGRRHQQKPDLDNLEKALKDTLFYKHLVRNDCEISSSNSTKIWGNDGKILIEIQ